MRRNGNFEGAALRERLGHPVIDADGHTVEFMPALAAYFKDEGLPDPASVVGAAYFEGKERVVRPGWWGLPTREARDHAATMLPALLYERLDELGLDFSLQFPTLGLLFPHIDHDEVRVASCRALNRYHSEIFAPFRDRLCPAAVIPMHTPQEAIAELTAAWEMGFRTAMIADYVRRPIEAVTQSDSSTGERLTWIDTYGLDSLYDYDPFWAKCIELGVSVSGHSNSFGWDGHASTSNYVYNHISHFALAHEALCKSLFMGGVTRRFPGLRVGALEGGVNWACSLYSDLIGHWEKRNPAALVNLDPSRLNRKEWGRLFERYGDRVASIAATGPTAGFSIATADQFALPSFDWTNGGDAIDEFAPCGITDARDIRDLFVPNFYFGCEADDPMIPHAFDARHNPFGARLNAMFGSDIGHWDVPDMNLVLLEAYEPVEHGHLDRTDFRDFVFTNAARFYTDTNPHFFDGTVIESSLEGRVTSRSDLTPNSEAGS